MIMYHSRGEQAGQAHGTRHDHPRRSVPLKVDRYAGQLTRREDPATAIKERDPA